MVLEFPIQLVPVGIICLSTSLVAGEYCMKDNTCLMRVMLPEDAAMANQLASIFSSLGICTNLASKFIPT